MLPTSENMRVISIHALREEGDEVVAARRRLSGRFLSTPSARRATQEPPKSEESEKISIHALREEGDADAAGVVLAPTEISIHALREEGDVSQLALDSLDGVFLSTPSARRATARSYTGRAAHRPFLSTPSARRATRSTSSASGTSRFLSTPSARRATTARRAPRDGYFISIHALREEGDQTVRRPRR